MFYKLKVLSSLLVFIFLNCVSVEDAKSIPFVGSVYSSLGNSFTNSHDLGFILNDTRETFEKKIVRNKNFNLSTGVSSKLPIPVIKNLRLQLNYIKSLNSSSNLIGLGLFYDIKTFPIVVPYLGVSFLNYNPSIVCNSEYTIKQKISQGLVSFNMGLFYNIPFSPFGVFAEYNYAVPGIFINHLKFNKFDTQYSSKDFQLNVITFGIKFYFL